MAGDLFSAKSRKPQVASFTLIELMAAAAITTLLLLGMTGIFDQAMKAWRLSSRRADAEREVRAALSTIQRDLSGCVTRISNSPAMGWPNGEPPWNQIPILRNVAPDPLPPRSIALARTNDSSIITFWTTLPASAQLSTDAENTNLGDLCGVTYYVGWDPASNQGRGAWNLYRRFQGSQRTYPMLLSFMTNPTTAALMDPSLPADQDEVVGANIVYFRAEFKLMPVGGGRRNTKVFPLDGPRITNRPGYVQLELTAFGSEAVRAFSTSNDWVNSRNIQKFGRNYLWRVDL